MASPLSPPFKVQSLSDAQPPFPTGVRRDVDEAAGGLDQRERADQVAQTP